MEEVRKAKRGGPRSRALLVLVLMLALTTGGCSTIRKAREAQDESQAPAGERTARAAEVGLTSSAMLTLDRALKIALDYHPSITQAKQNVAVAEAQWKSALGGYLPEVTGSLGVQTGTSNNGVTPASSHDRTSYSEQIRAGLLIYDFGKTDSAVRQAYEKKLAAEKALLSARNDLTYQVRLSYYGLYKAQSAEKIAKFATERYQTRRGQVRALLAAGRRIQYDLTRAEVDLGNAQLSQTRAEDAVKTGRAKLNQSLGLAEDPGYQITAPPDDDLPGALDELMDRAKKNNPDYLALLAQERSASALVDGSIAALFPSINLTYDYTWSGAQDPLTWNWGLGANLVWNLFQGFQRLRYIDQAAAQLRSARARVSAEEQAIFSELSSGLAQLEDARKRKTQAAEVMKSAQENLDLVNELYRMGRATALDQTDAELSFTGAQSEQLSAGYDVLAAVAGLRHTTGEDVQ